MNLQFARLSACVGGAVPITSIGASARQGVADLEPPKECKPFGVRKAQTRTIKVLCVPDGNLHTLYQRRQSPDSDQPTMEIAAVRPSPHLPWSGRLRCMWDPPGVEARRVSLFRLEGHGIMGACNDRGAACKLARNLGIGLSPRGSLNVRDTLPQCNCSPSEETLTR